MLKINYGLIDTSAADTAQASATDIQPFADAQQINTSDLDRLIVRKFGDLELNQWILDGTFEQFPDNPKAENWGFWSKQMSDENGVFAEPVVLTIEFTENHTSEGMTLYFRSDTGDYATDFTIEYYDNAGTLLSSADFTIDSAEFFAESVVSDYYKIVITFHKISKPYRYLKLSEVKYGSIKIFDENSVVEATILEEVDPTGAVLSINTMNCTVYTEDFQLLDPQGIYQMLQQKQAINISSYDDKGNATDYGTFFLEEPTSEDDDTTSFSCVDFLGVIDKTQFLGGMYTNKNAGELFDEIMLSAEVKDNEYDVTEDLRTKTITGYIPICSHREAVQQWAFAVGAVVECSRGKSIRAYIAPTTESGIITHDDKFTGHKITLKPFVTGVNVVAHEYTAGSDSSTAYEGILPVGDNVVTFSAPYSNISVSGGTLVESGANHAVVNMTAAGTAKITGKQYVDSTTLYSIKATGLPANAKPNEISVDTSATLINADNALEVAQRVFEYNQNRYQDEGDIILTSHRAGEMWRMNTINNRDIVGRLSRMEIDLIAEIANITLAGVSDERTVSE